MRSIEELRRDYQATIFKIQSMGAEGNLMGEYIGFVHLPDCGTCSVVWGYNEAGYEHVSISPRHKNRMPSWDDMAKLKDVFFGPDEEVYQIMPKRKEYVNLQENCLHLWKSANGRELRELI